MVLTNSCFLSFCTLVTKETHWMEVSLKTMCVYCSSAQQCLGEGCATPDINGEMPWAVAALARLYQDMSLSCDRLITGANGALL